jgi:hypothetical protein
MIDSGRFVIPTTGRIFFDKDSLFIFERRFLPLVEMTKRAFLLNLKLFLEYEIERRYCC